MLVYKGCLNKGPQTEWFKQQEMIFSQFCRPEFQEQGVLELVPSKGRVGGICSRFPLGWSWPFPRYVSSHCPPSSCISVHKFPPFTRTPVILDQGHLNDVT